MEIPNFQLKPFFQSQHPNMVSGRPFNNNLHKLSLYVQHDHVQGKMGP